MTGPTLERTRLEERLAQAHRDVQELATQVESGEVDPHTAERLQAGYHEEISALEAQLDSLSDASPVGRSPSRVLVGTLLFAGAVAVIVVLAAQFVVPRDEGTGIAAPVDPESISDEALEAVIAANADHPEIDGMRMALADRYFVAGNFRAALPHYQAVLESNSEGPEMPIALARVGWMFYQSGGEPDVAIDYLNESLARAPGYDEAQLYLASVYLYGLEDVSSARDLLMELVGRRDLSPELADVVAQLLADAESRP